jgi:threonine/homoserine/homoserine lactone efflux protein
MNEIIRNILLGLTLAAPLGPAGVAVIQNGLKGGFRRALLTGIGVTLADTTYLLIVFFGLAGLMTIPAVKILVWACGALVLFYLGIGSLREGTRAGGRRIDFEGAARPAPPARSPLLVGYLINLSNPIAIVFWVGIFGSLLGSMSGEVSRTSALLTSSTILVGILIWHTTTSLLTHWGRRFLNERTARVISVLAGLALIGFGLRFAYYAVVTILQS